ncbi:MAG: DNA cytosine methyltransferase, partial [Deltaproteobacteria bacterium]|nr:DNA cytosine methyltransferase [Deltaproteobacteria bacterium]
VERIARTIPKTNLFVMVGGPPCQGFSQQRRGADEDIRNNLVVRFASVIKDLPQLPAAVVLENVTYLDSPRGENVFRQYLAAIEKLGFITFRHDLNSAEFGVPQLRRRIIVVAIKEEFAENYSDPMPLMPNRWPTIGEFLCDLPPPGSLTLFPVANHEKNREGSLNKRRIMFVEMGKGRLSIPDELQLPCHRRYGGHLDVYGRLDWFSQARTITGGFDSFTRGEFAHPFYHRSITSREAARIQGFPDWFVFLGNRADIRRQIGNAVPPPMAFAVGKALFDAIAVSKHSYGISTSSLHLRSQHVPSHR